MFATETLRRWPLIVQVGSSWYAFAVPLHGGRGFGLLCAVSALVGFWAAHETRRGLMRLVSACPRAGCRIRRPALEWNVPSRAHAHAPVRHVALSQVCALCVVVMVVGIAFLWRALELLLAYDPGLHMSTQQTLSIFVALSAGMSLLQVRSLPQPWTHAQKSLAELWATASGWHRGSAGMHVAPLRGMARPIWRPWGKRSRIALLLSQGGRP